MAADSLTVTTDGHTSSSVGLHAIDAVGRLILRAPALSCLVTAVAAAPEGALPATVEVTDVAAVAVRDRVRARLTVHGTLSLVHPGNCSEPPDPDLAELRVEIAVAELAESDGDDWPGPPTVVDPIAFAAAETDPLCRAEADMLLHMAAAHRDAVALLTRLIEPRLLLGVVRVEPYAVDRYGITLRLECGAGGRRHADVRLPYAARAADVPHAQRELNALLAAATHARPCATGVPDRFRQRTRDHPA